MIEERVHFPYVWQNFEIYDGSTCEERIRRDLYLCALKKADVTIILKAYHG